MWSEHAGESVMLGRNAYSMMELPPEAYFFEQQHGYIDDLDPSRGSRCLLCELNMQPTEWTSHESDETHMSKLNALTKVAADERVLYKRRIETLSWKTRISSLHPAST
jgi:hypothetical protein